MLQAWVYILTNRPNGVLYIGVTKDISRRIFEHQHGLVDGFTKKYKLRHLVYVEHHARLTEALAREKAMKAWQRAWKIELIEQSNPNWRDLTSEIAVRLD